MQWIPIFHLYQPPHWDPVIIEKVARESYRKLCAILRAAPLLKCTINITGSLTEQLEHLGFRDILHNLRVFAAAGQVEFLASAMDHPILPLLPDHEIERQIDLNAKINHRVFGKAYRPRGFWLPELAYSERVAKIVREKKFHYLVLDPVTHDGPVPCETRLMIQNIGLDVIFRNRAVSDAFFNPSIETPNDFLAKIRERHDTKHPLVTALDGENLGHHRKGMDVLFQKIVEMKLATFLTASDYLFSLRRSTYIHIREGSWASREEELQHGVPFVLWNDAGNPIHERQWKLLHMLHTIVETLNDDPQYMRAREMLDECMASDQFFWASAKPWWNAAIIRTQAERTVAVARRLKTISPSAMEALQTLVKEICALAADWERSGKAARTKREYLHFDRTPRFMGGHAIS